MAKSLMKWTFTDPVDQEFPSGNFFVEKASRINRLYFPLFNHKGFMSSITPELKGDIKTSQNTFLLEPQVTETLLQTKNSRNFWIRTNRNQIWSVPGISSEELAEKAKKRDTANTDVLAGPGYFSLIRINKKLKLKTRIDTFVPSGGEPFEISIINLKNEGTKDISFTFTTAIPLYGRSADNLRDHRQVTTLLNRIRKTKNGILLTPTMSFDERGHKPGEYTYSAHAFKDGKESLEGIVSDLETFIGEGGSLESPEMIYSSKPFKDPCFSDGRQIISGLRFKEITLKPDENTDFVSILGIHPENNNIDDLLKKFNSVKKAKKALTETKLFWQNQINRLVIRTNSKIFDNWFVWVSLQPVMRRVFGCSFLPDFGYGRGGRGWRDLWQDLLGILLTNPVEVRELLLNNIQGIRVDGSNATIIGSSPGEFIADRNNIPRTWMDHGVWPLITLDLYIEQSGDWKILLEKRPFFHDGFSHRSRQINEISKHQKKYWFCNKNRAIYKKEIILHLLLQNLTQVYNRGDNGNIRLEDADWNDGLDMAHDKGESVPFSCAYAGNLKTLSRYFSLMLQNGIQTLEFPSELNLLLTPFNRKNQYVNPKHLRTRLNQYFEAVRFGFSGKMQTFKLLKIKKFLLTLSETLSSHIQNNEWIKTGSHEYFNGYYDNCGKRVEGVLNGKEQMTLTAQVFPIMFKSASLEQSKKSFQAAKDLLKSKVLGGYRLNTNFDKTMLNLGRAFSFSYGDKENGSFFSHMNVMFANALYQRGLVREGYEVLNSIFQMCQNTNKSLIFPCIPEYFNSYGRGLYCYITGSGAWMTMTVLTEVFGIKGKMGRLAFHPKLLSKQFTKNHLLKVKTLFQGKKILVTYHNPQKLSYGQYKISNINCFKKEIPFEFDDQMNAVLSLTKLKQFTEPLNFDIFLSKK